MKKTQTVPYKFLKLNADTLTPIGIFQSLSGKKKFLLESTLQHEEKGKYSFIGAEPYQEIIGIGNYTIVKNLENEKVNKYSGNFLEYMKNHLPKIEIDLPLPFYGGAVGYIGYDSIRQFENIGPLLSDDLDMPDIHFMVYKNVIIFDHSDETVYVVAMNPECEDETFLEERIQFLRSSLTTKPDTTEGDFSGVKFEPEWTERQFIEKVQIAQEKIHQGEVLQVVLSQRMKAKMNEDPFTFYRGLRRANPSPYMFYIDFEDYLILGASPESLLQTTGKDMVTNPIAGTRARGKTSQEDEALIKDLLTDKKELSEHQMLVDLSISDLRKVCEKDSITVPTYMKIEKYQFVSHIVSEVKGRLRENLSSLDALIACLPAGTVSGEPKVRAMQIINELEETKRGVYAGGIGYINFNHDLNIALAIRSLVIKESHAYLQAGAGIVYDSVPEKEYQETLHKAKSLMEVYQANPVNQ